MWLTLHDIGGSRRFFMRHAEAHENEAMDALPCQGRLAAVCTESSTTGNYSIDKVHFSRNEPHVVLLKR